MPQSAEDNSSTSPETEFICNGVSVEYARDASKEWFVIRVSYNREQKACDYLLDHGIAAYLPSMRKLRIIDGKRKYVLTSLIPNILFVYDTPEKVRRLVEETPELPYLSYYYDHFHTDDFGKNPPLTVAYDRMMSFIRVTGVGSRHIRVVSSDKPLKKGAKVRIIDGDFAGVEGYVTRFAGQQRVVVTIDGLCSVTTAYIPSAFLEEM